MRVEITNTVLALSLFVWLTLTRKSSRNDQPTSNPGSHPSSKPQTQLTAYNYDTYGLVTSELAASGRLYVYKNLQDQRASPGVNAAVILAAEPANREEYSAALVHLIARSQDVACFGFLL